MASDGHVTEAHGSPLNPRQYIIIGLVLTVITAVELWVSYSGLGSLLVPTLLILSAVKFVVVVALFMHLKFESRLFTWMFLTGLLLGGAILIALVALFRHDPSDALGGGVIESGGHGARFLLEQVRAL
ncbi:MAG: cytochrome C oxidase subunit IV family protein [Dehalococcoidia bacterium]|jgi:caa(3)-type oxidase subunit IV|nr:cytochrome C oxidase subunit IV family protein [Dehalococcoidia bacterium]